MSQSAAGEKITGVPAMPQGLTFEQVAAKRGIAADDCSE
jgi:hypothetical protein